ncbi:protein ANTI-SILENCING 1 isoform X2 [Dendrobium catenatum]|uniref:DNA (Cytosine-5-)-methyltransferase n=1 Tax=Dendrobium catenatum TaxID=906689 RepID=A0A2I0WHP9_9ASPA|nr:protein ANTI-SILENCING 1 isoform X2 [Dendrobium catenatum]PKU75186.1 DNA (cytosine-5-)-methyltransferase [Dendrobium catenatum]
MPQLEESENGDLQFQWGKRRGVGNANKDVQFYESFIYDEESYSLYDNVYLFKEGDSEPYVGKILKIWEQPGQKRRIKILWFFRPNDISRYLDGHASSEKDLFLASGEGVGLSNINPLEAIAGKCSVICTLRDERNPQPSSIAIEKADFIFSRFFDVGSCTVLETPPEAIAGVELKYLLNHPKDQKPEHSVKLEVVDSGAFDDSFIKKLGPVNDLAKLRLDAQIESDPGTKKPTIKSEDLDYDLQRKARPNDGLMKHTFDDQETSDSSTRKRKYVSDEDNQDDDSVQVPKVSSQLAELAEAKNNSLDVLPLKPNSAALHRSRWFADMPWKARIEKAHHQGKLMFLENLDPSYSASEIEDLLLEAFKLDCTVKVIPHVTFHNPHYGQAYVICNSRNEATNAVQEIDEKCLILSDGRPLCAKLGMIELPQKAAKFPGHLKVEKGRLQPVRIEHKQAVATSHCSQPNTIEYELAMEWLLLFEKYQRSKEKLLKKQHRQFRAFISKYSDK